MKKQLLKFTLIPLAVLTLAGCESKNPAKPLAGITLEMNSAYVRVNEEVEVKATLTPTDTTETDLTWSVGDTTLASVNNGKVKGLKAGETSVIAKGGTNIESSKKFTVVPTIAEALAILAAYPDKSIGSDKLLIKGTIEEVSNAQYGEMTVKDDTGSLFVYGTYSADGVSRYSELSDKPVKGDTVVLYGLLCEYKGTPEMKAGWIQEFSHDTPKPEHDYEKMSIKQARSATQDTYIETTGVVAALTYSNNKTVPNGFMLWDNEASIYVYGGDTAGPVSKGDKVPIQAKKDYYVLDTEKHTPKSLVILVVINFLKQL